MAIDSDTHNKEHKQAYFSILASIIATSISPTTVMSAIQFMNICEWSGIGPGLSTSSLLVTIRLIYKDFSTGALKV